MWIKNYVNGSYVDGVWESKGFSNTVVQNNVLISEAKLQNDSQHWPIYQNNFAMLLVSLLHATK